MVLITARRTALKKMVIYYFFKVLFTLIYKILFRYTVEGEHNIPRTGGVIIASNHLSYLDPILIGISMKRQAYYMAKASLFKNPLISWFVRIFSIPVDRESPKPSTIKEAVKILKEGRVLVLFPEGGRSRSGEIGGGKRGVAMIAAMSKAPVVPAYIEGTDRALPRGAKFIRPVRVRIVFGKPIEIQSTESSRDYQKRLAEEIMEHIRKLKMH
ncbi:MAG TPA: 1-acyl-sn-glycerol-3-phosphate acyltransferase [Nitrospirae bacterium]|nr:1-acyl-sn-glycerol-3-phosphate acyltransferase [Nitrospirota bacterium]